MILTDVTHQCCCNLGLTIIKDGAHLLGLCEQRLCTESDWPLRKHQFTWEHRGCCSGTVHLSNDVKSLPISRLLNKKYISTACEYGVLSSISKITTVASFASFNDLCCLLKRKDRLMSCFNLLIKHLWRARVPLSDITISVFWLSFGAEILSW